ncbi:DUF2958 domain-containing protein [Nodularia spumigena CS-591/12]|uniref:DUF2958 domain-containing protein n=1 Tax=Nodularia spumigena TaxID=70799 RepID=UPI0023305D71|nr:DUF2958 domain-containing protein [Nodularia spumigena]MDB9305016.1 DUF2958 domain-containing protein [Nodularia spumigena CS-591/12]MDB9346857.1 DUF2958 domain-containing protein [Nodularia spumigena CS-588/01]
MTTVISFPSDAEEELSYFSLTELQEYRGRLGVDIERDLHFRPTPLSKLRRN